MASKCEIWQKKKRKKERKKRKERRGQRKSEKISLGGDESLTKIKNKNKNKNKKKKEGPGRKSGKSGSTEIWTRIAGFRVQSANHYTIEPWPCREARF